MHGTTTPRVAGVAGGVGTSIISAALRALDCRTCQPNAPVDVLVCRATTESLVRAQYVLGRVGAAPILAVVSDVSGFLGAPNVPASAHDLLRKIADDRTNAVVIPFVKSWRDVANPWQHAYATLEQSPTRATRKFRTAIDQLVDLILRTRHPTFQYRPSTSQEEPR